MDNFFPDKIKKHLEGMECNQNTIGCSQARVYKFSSLKSTYYLKIEPKTGELGIEYNNLLWLQNKIPVPQVVEWTSDDGYNYLLINEVNGKMLCDDYYLKNPETAVKVLADGIKMLQSVSIENCPIKNNLDCKLKSASENVQLGKVNMDDWEIETTQRFTSPGELMMYLEKNKLNLEETALTHGDYCLPNIFGEKNKLTGFIDLSRVGIGDIWQDIALCLRSLHYNFNTDRYDDLFLKSTEAPLDNEKLDYYILLDELF